MAEDEDTERSTLSLFLERLGLSLTYQRQLKSCGGVILTRVVTGIIKHLNDQSYSNHAHAIPSIIMKGAPTVMAVCGVCGATGAAYMYGRKKVITVVIIMYLVPLLISATDLGPFVDYLGALTDQLGQNMIPIMYSIYIAEVVDAKLRAFFFGLYFPATRVGTIISQLLPLPSKLAILCGLILIITALVLSVLAPETPYWLALVGRREEAERVVEWLRTRPATASEGTYVFERAEYDAERKYTELVPIILSRRFYIPVVLYLFAVLGSFDLCTLYSSAAYRRADALGMDYSFMERPVAAQYTVGFFIRDVYFFLGCGLYQFLCLIMPRRRLFLMSMLLTLAFFWTNLASFLGVAPFMVVMHACQIFLHMGTVQINVMYPPEIFPSILRELGVGTCYAIYIFLDAFENYGKLHKPRSVADFFSVAIFTGYPVGLVFSYLMMPETKDIPQVEVENVARYLKVMPLAKAAEDEEDES